MSTLALEPYVAQSALWPAAGRHILAQFDAHSVVVYQAYRPSIAAYAVAHGRLGGPEFSRSRMSWIKPNFLWMMYRSGWAGKPDQHAVLAIRIAREGFDAMLAAAVPSSYARKLYPDRDAWQRAVEASDVRLQWDPDHHPGGEPAERRAIQIGLRGAMLHRYVDEWTLGIEDVTALARAQHPHAMPPYEHLVTPREDVYVPADPAVARHVALDEPPRGTTDTSTNHPKEAATMSEADNLFGDEHVKRYRETGGAVGHIWREGSTILLLTTTGRTSGEQRTVPLIYAEDGGAYVIIASKGGAPEDPGWYKNLAKTPEVELQVESEVFRARARVATGAERAKLWRKANEVWPHYDEYAARTTREIPVVVLERI